jgi:hypothetical protein
MTVRLPALRSLASSRSEASDGNTGVPGAFANNTGGMTAPDANNTGVSPCLERTATPSG